MALSPGLVIFVALWILGIFGVLFALYYFLTWNIPVIVLRFQGDKRRPQIVITKGRRAVFAGVGRLWVRGYSLPFRDFKSELYYPSKKGKNGALILWEAKPGLLTPAIPKRIKGLTKVQHDRVLKEYLYWFDIVSKTTLGTVRWSHDDALYKSLLLEAVDDTDIDFLLQHNLRVDSQYVMGWRGFLDKYGGHAAIVIIAICLLTGFIIWLDKSPALLASCSAAAQEQSLNVLRQFSSTLPGAPPV